MNTFQTLLDELNAVREQLDAFNRAYIPYHSPHEYMDTIHEALYHHAHQRSDPVEANKIHDIRLKLLDSTFDEILAAPWETRQTILDGLQAYCGPNGDVHEDERQFIIWRLIATSDS